MQFLIHVADLTEVPSLAEVSAEVAGIEYARIMAETGVPGKIAAGVCRQRPHGRAWLRVRH